jgi:hypothetical protein
MLKSKSKQLVYLGVSQLVYLGASQLVYLGASQLVYLGASQLVYLGVSQNRPVEATVPGRPRRSAAVLTLKY